MAQSTFPLTAHGDRPGDLWSAAGSSLKAQGPPLEAIPRGGALPLSFAQERVRFLSQADPEAPHYNVPLAWRVSGPLRADLLEDSLRTIVRRHEILRTTFPVIGGSPAAVIAEEVEFHLRVVDLESLARDQRMPEALRIATEDAGKPFDLAHGPLCCTVLFQLGPEDFLLLLTVHQMVFDGGSIRVFIQELRALYESSLDGRRLVLPDVSLQYADFAFWQRRLVASNYWQSEVEYWRNQLHSSYRPLQLPVDHPRQAGKAMLGCKRPWSLSRDLTNQLTRLGQQENATRFTVLLAGLQVLLHRYSGQEDIMVLGSAGGRGRPELRGMIGLFANLLPLRADLSGAPTFRELLRRVREVTLTAYANQTLPCEKILEMLHPVHAADGAPVFQVMLLYQNAPWPDLVLPDVTFRPLGLDGVDTHVAKFDLQWEVAETREGLRGTFKHRSDLFEDATIAGILQNFELLLKGIVADPDQSIRSIPVKRDGKIDPERPFSKHPSSESGETTALTAPVGALESQLAVVWERLFGRQIGVRDDFFDLGGHSLLALRLFAEMEPILGRRLPLATLFEAPTIEKLVRTLRQEGWTPPYSSLVPIQSAGSRPPVYCISGVGGSVFLFHRLARYLGADQPVYGLEPPHPESGPALTCLEDIATHYLQEVHATQPEGPYYFIGFSFGGLVAFEMAQQLRAKGERAGLVALFDAYQSGSIKERSAMMRLRGMLRGYVARVGSIAFEKDKGEQLKRLFKGKSLKILFGLYRLIGRPVPPTLAATGTMEDIQVFARNHYRPSPYPGGVTLFRASIRPESEDFDYEMGWTKLAAGGVEVHDVPGDHHSMAQEPNIQVLAAKFKACLDSALAKEHAESGIAVEAEHDSTGA